MKKYFILLLLIASTVARAQSDSSAATEEQKGPQFKLSLNYNSNLNYYGRTDSLKSTGFFPMAELYITPKFYVNAAPIFVNNAVQSFEYAGTVATAGYLDITDKWITNAYVLKPFYTQSARLVQSALQLQTGLTLSRLTKFININAGGDLRFSDKLDFGAQAGLDKIIRKQLGGTVLVLDPSFYAYAGTQNYTRTYNKKVSSGVPVLGGTSNQQVNERVSEFNILSYEASIPVILVKNKWMFMATPAYVIPQNLLTVPNRPDLSERGENRLYATFSLKYSF